MIELKRCPFCGSDDVGIGHKLPEFGEELTHYVVCNKCGSKTANFRNEKTAVNVWEARAENEEHKFTRQFIHEHGLEFALASAWERRKKDGA